ncbi:MAG: winged helix-turn-helix transcriptional regulator [Rhodospirillales bacterium]|uniref:ArsR family transcriptional regulator n=1 Tax=Thalassospira permensis NBRC 106175 TaxID=1353532 RepID=A0ABR4TPS2_9PROT|nr:MULTISPECIES: winged helix-turn-helix domain-containing protein [Thalassospira]KEO57657.1 ArsR family transcriptional regulator [Thalassospira permensis NBRC 106175]MBR9781800.1 winged helix-turn-helix transcriptional regulator [Rhodospirillales bacterium]MBR9819037.1 winged helix-turn-helix transcriptional regulator [Rhodospirillales bacterium]RCK40885.1 ArsR family transcriptional regulator [Thalassospira xiamenensis]
MKEGPDIARVAALLGDPARANMLTALMSGRALTAAELAQEAGVTPQTASSHLAKLEAGQIVIPRKQGRHRYFTLSGPDIVEALEVLMGIASRVGHNRVRTGPKDPALRKARVCYDHLAGEMGVALFSGLEARKLISTDHNGVALTDAGADFAEAFGINLNELRTSRRPLCRECLDWSARQSHLAGSFGAALLDRFYDLGWAHRSKESRVVIFSPEGERNFKALCDS